MRDAQRDLNKKVGLRTLDDIETESVDGTQTPCYQFASTKIEYHTH